MFIANLFGIIPQGITIILRERRYLLIILFVIGGVISFVAFFLAHPKKDKVNEMWKKIRLVISSISIGILLIGFGFVIYDSLAVAFICFFLSAGYSMASAFNEWILLRKIKEK